MTETAAAESRLPALAVAAERGRCRVLLDGFFIDRPYGFGRYLRELVEAIDRQAPTVDLVVAVQPQAAALARRLAPGAEIVSGPRCNLLFWEQLVIPRLARAARVDLVHSPANTRPLLRLGASGVVTLHDLVFDRQRLFDGSLTDIAFRLYSKLCLRLLARSHDAIVSVSRTTADELSQCFGRSSVVIPNSASGFARTTGTARADGRYLLHRGGVAPHRNTARVVAAFATSGLAATGIELRIFGLAADSPLARSLAGPGIVVLPPLSDAALAAQYRGALAVLALSLEEGFGLPIVEAFAFGTALIASNRAPMNEIAGAAALLVDPTDTVAIRLAIEQLVGDDGLRRRLVAAGGTRATAFDHPGIAARLASVYARCHAAASPAPARR
jgi:glycosyltransferase involved in cell wall biosynthesis